MYFEHLGNSLNFQESQLKSHCMKSLSRSLDPKVGSESVESVRYVLELFVCETVMENATVDASSNRHQFQENATWSENCPCEGAWRRVALPQVSSAFRGSFVTEESSYGSSRSILSCFLVCGEKGANFLLRFIVHTFSFFY
jgi:hypothetical protein